MDIKKYWEQMNFYLDKLKLENSEKKLRLIELLLLIGTLSATFNLPKEWTWIYMLFLLLSIVYFVLIQKESQNFLYRYSFIDIVFLEFQL